MTNSDITLAGLTPFFEYGFSVDINWFSETQSAGAALTVLAQSGLLSNLGEFTDEYVGSSFDALEAGLAWGESGSNELNGVLTTTVLSLFIPMQDSIESDWKSIYMFGKDALTNTPTTIENEQLAEDSCSLIVSAVDKTSEQFVVLFHVTPMGAIWITSDTLSTKPDIKTLLKKSRQIINASHRQQMQTDSFDKVKIKCGLSCKPDSKPLSKNSGPSRPVRQLFAAGEEYNS